MSDDRCYPVAVTFDARALERIQVTARDIDPVKVAVTVVTAIPFLLGWIVAKVFAVVWLVLSWVIAAGMEGWRAGRSPKSSGLRSGWGGGS